MKLKVVPGSPASDQDVHAVLAALYRQRAPSAVLALAQRTSLSTLVVIPALGELIEQGLAIRLAVDGGSTGRRTWNYQLTPQGRRTYQARI